MNAKTEVVKEGESAACPGHTQTTRDTASLLAWRRLQGSGGVKPATTAPRATAEARARPSLQLCRLRGEGAAAGKRAAGSGWLPASGERSRGHHGHRRSEAKPQAIGRPRPDSEGGCANHRFAAEETASCCKTPPPRAFTAR